jgi:predicted nucleotidyltransferase
MEVSSASRPGRRSLSGAGDSPQLNIRLSTELRDALVARAGAAEQSVSEYVRSVLEASVTTARSPRPLSGPRGRRLRSRRKAVIAALASHGLTNPRVFGSVARGDEGRDSDIDLLVDLAAGAGLFALARARADVERILGAPVELVPAANLKAAVSSSAHAEAIAL